MDQQPHGSPWGEVQSCDRLCRGVYCVSTAGHGGIMIQKDIARKILSVEARRIAVMDHGYACFEEDCAATVAYRELLDQGLCQAPAYMSPEAFSEAIDRGIQRWYPDYWRVYQQNKAKRPHADTCIKDWYKQSYPSDGLGDAIRSDITFQSLFDAMEAYQSVYQALGVSDSLVRERVFHRLAEISGMTYEAIYDQWLKCSE